MTECVQHAYFVTPMVSHMSTLFWLRTVPRTAGIYEIHEQKTCHQGDTQENQNTLDRNRANVALATNALAKQTRPWWTNEKRTTLRP